MVKIVSQFKKFITGSLVEAKKITWPSKKQLFEHSLVVIGALIISLVIIAAIDYGLSYVVKHYIFGV